MEAKVYNQKGKSSEQISLPEKVFGAKWRADLVHQVVESMRSNARINTAHAKTRAEVRGGGKKPWKQKGTGRARHGSRRSPIWVGGGVTHGPLKEKNYKKTITKKMKAQALFSVLSKKFKDGEILFVDNLDTGEMKTKTGAGVIKNLANVPGFKGLNSKKPKAFVALFDKNDNAEKSLQNLPQVELGLLKNLNPLSVLQYKYLVIEKPQESVEFLATRG